MWVIIRFFIIEIDFDSWVIILFFIIKIDFDLWLTILFSSLKLILIYEFSVKPTYGFMRKKQIMESDQIQHFKRWNFFLIVVQNTVERVPL